jgi:hypothetical protein
MGASPGIKAAGHWMHFYFVWRSVRSRYKGANLEQLIAKWQTILSCDLS